MTDDAETSEVVPTPAPRTRVELMLDLHGVEPVEVPGNDQNTSLANAIATTLYPASLEERQALVNRIDSTMTPVDIAKVTTSRVHVLMPDGTFFSFGPVTGRPVHVVESRTSDGGVRYLATRETVHIGRMGLSYPGSTKQEHNGKWHTIHRGEFEVETIAGRHHVRIYTAVVNQENLETVQPQNVEGVQPQSKEGAKPPRYKDIQQVPVSGGLKFNADGALLWAGAGRPLRALQWLEKYDLAEGRGKPAKPGAEPVRPILRSYLVPLDTFNKITNETRSEAAKVGDSTINVDMSGEPNQFGIGGDHLKDLKVNAMPGSLISYPANPEPQFTVEDQAGRVVPVSELYQRVGLDPDFRSDALGMDNDPWFSWVKQEDGSWKQYFLNDAHRLHDIATRLREHHLTWEQSKQDPASRTSDALIEPDAYTIPSAKQDASPPPVDTTFEARVQRLNMFLNEVGPPAVNVERVTTKVRSTGAQVLKEHLVAAGTLPVDQAAFERMLRENVVPGAVKDAFIPLDKNIKKLDPNVKTRAQVEGLVKGKKAKKFTTDIVDKAVSRFEAEVGKHPDLALLDENSRLAVVDALSKQMRDALTGQFTRLADLDGLAPAKGKAAGWLSGERLTAFGDRVAEHVNNQQVPSTTLQIDESQIAEVAEKRVLGTVIVGVLDSFTSKDLVNATPSELRSAVHNELLPGVRTATSSALRSHPALAVVDQDLRNAIAGKVANDAKTRVEQELASFDFVPVTVAEVDAFMAKVTGFATQAEIGALMSADSTRIALDVNTREFGADPFPNSFYEWKQQRPAQLAAQRQIGDSLSKMINESRGPETAVEPETVAAVVKELTVRHPELDRKFDEVATKVQKVPSRAPGDKSAHTFYEHAQMVLGQFLKLTANENADTRLVPVDALAKAILFHDLEKDNAENQFGDGKGRHKLAVEMMDRYRGLWNNEQEFQVVRAIVGSDLFDSDPFGFYVRDKMSADETFKFINDLATKMDPAGRPENAKKMFEELHQYYQADFSSYTEHSTFVDREGDVQTGPNHFNDKFAHSPGGITKTPDGRHFEYAANSDAAKRTATLSEMFRDPDTIRANRARLENATSAAPGAPRWSSAPVELSFDFAPGVNDLTTEQSSQVSTLAENIVNTANKRAALGYSPPKVEVSGPHAWSVKPVLAARLGGLVEVQVVPGRLSGVDVRVDWDLNRAEAPSKPSRKVIDDESWRHHGKSTAAWSAPSDPVSPDVWQERREGAHMRTVDTEVAGVTTYSTPSNITMYRTIVAYDLRRIEVRPGQFVQEYTVKVHLQPGADVDPATLDLVREKAVRGVNSLLNQGYRLPSGDQFHVNLEFTDNPADAHTTVQVRDIHSDQTNWNPEAGPEVLAHETLHYLGVPDEYVDKERVFLSPQGVRSQSGSRSRSGVHVNDGSMMSVDLFRPDTALMPRHLWLIERTATSQVAVPDTVLDTPGTAVPASRSLPFTGSRPAPGDVTAAPAVPAPTRPAPVAEVAGPSTEPPPSSTTPPLPEPPSVTPVLPSRDLPSFFQDGTALGTIAPVEVNGGPEIEQAVAALLPQRQGVTPRGVDQIAPALTQNFESFLGNGRNFQIKVGKDWFEANVRATLGVGTDAEVTPATKVDFTAQSGNVTSHTATLATAGDVGAAAGVGMAVGAQGTLAGKVALARPAMSATTGTSTTDQRAIRAGMPAFGATVPVDFQVTLTDARGGQVGVPTSLRQNVELLIPGDLGSITPAAPNLPAASPEPGWAATLEHPAPEAVTDLDSAKAFEDVARQLHPSVTKLGAPGRTALQEFLSPTSIRDNLGAALNGWVVSPDLSSPHGSRGGVVRMRAVPVSVELVGTTSSTNLRVHESVARNTGLSAATKSGFDASLTVGGGKTVAGKVGGTASVTAGYSARTTESSSAGTSATAKTGMQVKGELGLYRTKVRLEFETPHGAMIPVDATAFLRAGLPEAGSAGLPVPPDAPTSLATPTPEPKFPPPFLASVAAAGAVKVGAFTPAAEVQSQVENALRDIPGFEKFLPSFANQASDPRKAGKNMQDLADQLANQRKLATELSPTALKAQMDSLLGAGVQVQLKRQGLATNDFVNITVKAKVTNPVHLGQADARNVRGSAATGPKLDSSTATQKGWSVGVEAKVVVPKTSGKTTVTPTPSVGAKFSGTTVTKTTAGPTVGTTRASAGSPNSQLFQHDVTFEVEVTKFSRNRAWVKRLTPGSPLLQVPTAKTVAKTGVNLPEISGKVNLWVSDGAAMSSDPSAFAPGAAAAPVVLANPPTIHSLLTAPKPPSWPFLHVEAVANTEAVRDAAIAALNASGDTALTVPGTESRNRIDKLFSPENIKANLPTLVGKGMTEGGMKYGRRVADRTGAVGMAVGLSNPKLVSISDEISLETAHTGGFKAGESKTVSRSADVTAGLNTPMRPTQGAVGAGAVGATAKWTPWSKTSTKGTETSGSVDRNKVMPSSGRTVLVQLDAQVTVVGESRASNTVHKGSPKVAGSVVSLPGGVFVRVSEEVARDMGVLPSVGSTAAPVEQGTMASPSMLRAGEPGALGLGLVEQAPDLSDLVPQLRENLGKLGKDLLPKSVLNDSMNNLQRLTDLTSDASVKALVDSALDGGVPLLVHDPGVFGKDTFQVTLKATPGTPVFDGAVNDGVEMEHTATGAHALSRTKGGGTGWGVGVKAPGSALPNTHDKNVSANVGGAVAGNMGQAHSQSTTVTTTNQLGHVHVGTGPAARFTVPVTFELVVEKGSKEIGRATSGPVDMSVRVHADNQKTTVADPAPFEATPTTRPAQDGATEAALEWQRSPSGDAAPVQLPPMASVESLRGAQALQDAAIRALLGAGAGSGITGKGTGALNALRSGLALESLQPNLPGMLDGAFEVPGLHEAALTKGQHANVKVFAKLVNPRLEALSDGVQVFNPRSTVTAVSSEAKHGDTADASLAFAPGGVTSKKPDVGLTAGGLEVRHALEDSGAVAGGTTHNPASLVKAEGRTGLVGFDVEFRVVADLGKGRVGVVDLSVPNSAQVRMFGPDAEAALGRPLSEDLGTAQTGVKEAGKAWREAEVAADQVRHAAQTTINGLAPRLATALDEVAARVGELEIAEQSLVDATTGLDTAQRARTEAAQAVESAETAVEEAANTVYDSELTAALAEQEALAAQLDVDETTAHEQAALAAQVEANEVAAQAQAALAAQLEANDATAPEQAARLNDATARVQMARVQAELSQEAARDAAQARQQAVQVHLEALAASSRAAEVAARARDLHAEVVTNLGTAQENLTTAENVVLAAENDLRQAEINRDATRVRLDEAVQAEQSLRAEVAQVEAEVERARVQASQAQQAWWQAKTAVDQEVDRFNTTPLAVTSAPTPDSPDASSSPATPEPTRVAEPPAPAPARSAPDLSIELPPGTTSLNFQHLMQIEALGERLTRQQTTRTAQGLPSPVVEITGEHAALVAEPLSREVSVEIRVEPGRPNAADVHVHLDPITEAGPSRPAPVAEEAPGDTPLPNMRPGSDARPGKKVIDDESWRHNPAATADWFAPNDPVSPAAWENRRESAHVRTADTVVADVQTGSTRTNIKSVDGLVRFDLRRFEVRPNQFVQEYTVKVHLQPGAQVDPAVLNEVGNNARNGVNSLLNQGFRLPSGDQFHLNLEFTDNPAEAHTTVEVGDTGTDQTHWNPNTSPAVLAHEMLHYLGVPDEYEDDSRVFLENTSRSGVHLRDGGMMGKDVLRPGAGLRPRHLWLVERTANSQVAVHDTRLDAPAATLPSTQAPGHAPDTGRSADDMPTRPAPVVDVAGPSTEALSSSAGPSSTTPSRPEPLVLPSRDVPPFLQDGTALGTIAPVEVNGGPEIEQAVAGLLPQRAGVTPRGVDQIAPALTQNFESFLGKGRDFQIRVGKDWFEANVRATLGARTDADVTPTTKVDFTAQSGNSTSQTGTIGTAGDVGGALTLGMLVGAQGTVAGKVALARPVTSTTTGTSTTDQRAVNSGEAAFRATVPVAFQITLSDRQGAQVGAPVSVEQNVSLLVPGDVLTPADPSLGEVRLEPGWAATLEHPAPEAVTDLDSAKAFEDIARQLHPSVTKLGAPGRTALREFLSPTSIRDNLGAALNGWVVSPDLSSPHGSRGGVVRMRAVPVSVELVGTTSSATVRVHESVATSTALSAATKSGFDASLTVGGGKTVAGKVGGTAALTGGYTTRTTESSSAGTSATTKTGIQVKGELGLYKTKVRLEFETPHGTTIPMDATAFLRAGLPEAGAAGLPVPPDAPTSLAAPTPEPKFPPPFLASAAAAGAVKVGAFTPAAEVQSQVEGVLRGIPGFEKFLPTFADAASDPRRAGKNMQDLADQLANQRKLATELSPTALKTQMDSLLGAGVQVQLKRQGLTTNDFVNITVKAKVTNPVHLGQADARNVRGSAATAPKLDSSTATQKGWNLGVEAKVAIPSISKKTTATPTPSVGAKYSSTTTTKTTAGPTVGTTRATAGSPNSQLFQHDVTFEVEVTKFSRNRAWVKRVTPGSLSLQVPKPRTVARTGTNLPEISGKVNLWVSDGSAMSSDPSAFAPGAAAAPLVMVNPPTIHSLLTAPKRPTWPFLHVEAVANTEAVRDAAIAALNASGDTALTVPGTESRNRIDKLFSPENIKANLPTLVGKGMTEGGMKYGRRVADRIGAVGMAVGLSNPKLVSISDDVGVQAAYSGGFKAAESETVARAVDVTAGLNTPMKPTKGAVGSGAVGATAKWTPWSKTGTKGTESSGSVERNKAMPSTGRTVLVQLDAQVTVVGESRATNTVHKGSPKVAGSVVSLPGGVFVRVSEEVARDMGVLPSVGTATAPVEQGTLAPLSTLRAGEPGALGLGLVEQAPDLSSLVPQLRENLGKLGKDLLPKSVLNDSMNNLQRLTDLTSEASVKALVDSALDGGVPLLVHDPGVFSKDTFQVTLKATPGTPVFDGAVNDGVDIEHSATGTQVVTRTSGGGTGWGLGLKVPGSALPKTGDPNVSATVGGAAAGNVGQAHSQSTTETTTNQLGYARTGSGPAARFTVPVTFELVVEKGSKEIGRASSGQVEMAVRVLADNQKTTALAPAPFTPRVTTRPSEDGTSASTGEWQRTSVQLPPMASVESLRGAQALQDAAIRALMGAGAGSGITGKGTGALNALRSGLALESLQPNLPGMLDGAFEVPGLHEAALTKGQHANVKVYAKLVNPRLEALSDGVVVSNPRSTVTSTSSEAKHSDTADVSLAAAPGGVTSKKPDVGFSASGAEVRHAVEDSAAVTGGATHNPATSIKTEGRTGLVSFDVEYRVVADLGRGRLGVTELHLPGAAQVRMPAADAEAALARPLPEDLSTAQTGVKEAADSWRAAEVAADKARHAAQATINDLAPQLVAAADDITTRADELRTAEQSLVDGTTALDTAQRTRTEAAQAVERAETSVEEAASTVHDSELTAALAEQEALAARVNVDEATAREQAALAAQVELDEASAREQAAQPDVDETTAREQAARAEAARAQAELNREAVREAARARQQTVQDHQEALASSSRAAEVAARARDLHTEVVTSLVNARANLVAAENAVLAVENDLSQAQINRDAARMRRDEAVRAEQSLRAEVTRAEAEVERTRAEASQAQQAWWQAKTAVDQEVDRFNAAPSAAASAPDSPVTRSASSTPAASPATPASTEPLPTTPEVPTAVPPTSPAPELSMVLSPGSTSLTFQQLVELETLVERLTQLQATRAAQGSPPPVVEITGDHAAHVAELLSFEVSLEIRVAPGRPNAADVHVHLDPVPDTATTSEASVPVALDTQLSALTRTAMEGATPLMQSVANTLLSNPHRFVHSAAGMHLLQASVLLHTRTDEVAGLINEHGVHAVADAFIRQFERPIIETAQRESFTDLDTNAGRAAFESWAHQLWDTIENQQQFIENLDVLADSVFNHDKGFNRATNFAQAPMLAALIPPPTVSEAIADRSRPDADTSAQAMWLFQVLADAKLIPADASVSPDQFTAAVNEHRADLEAGIGVELDTHLVASLRQELTDFGMLDEDSDTEAESTSPAELDSRLSALTATAMEDASPLMRSVNETLEDDPRRFVNSTAGLHLLRASVLLHTKTDEIAGLINEHGVHAVADAFIRQFERPIIETAQREAFTDLSTEAGRTAFTNWAHQLWDTIENQPQLTDNPDALADQIFHHDKGFNRATNFAQAVMLDALIAPPTVGEAVASRGRPDSDTSAQAMWLFQVLADAKLIPADSSVSPEQFTAAVTDNRADLEAGIGVQLDDQLIAGLREELQSYGMVDEDADEPSTSEPIPPSAPPLLLDVGNELTVLTADAMENASPLMKSVEAAFRSNPQKYVHAEAGLHLLRASVVLDTRTDEIAGMILQHGVEAVARAFNTQFERPIIESAQLQSFAGIDIPDSRAAFGNWAHQLWDTINNTPRFTEAPDTLAGEIFNHDKGYNRATNFAQNAALAAIMGPPPLADAIANHPGPDNDTSAQAMWLFQVLAEAQLIPSDAVVSPDQFTAAVTGNRADLEAGIGVRLDDQLIAGLREELQSYGMVDEDADAPSTSEPTPIAPDVVADELAVLTADAMENASPLMKSVEAAFRSNPQKYVHSEAGTHLLHASVVLHTKADEIAGMIGRHGLEAVARAFNTRFERPIIETEQLRSFAGLDSPDGQAAFGNWAHQLWQTIDNTPQFTEAPDTLAGEIFNHDKGYNRATNFAQNAALAAIMGPPPLADAVSQRPAPGTDTLSQATWVYQVFSDAGLVAADGTDTAARFTELVQQNRADLESQLGALDDQRVADLRQELVDMVMLDDDSDADVPPTSVGDPNPLHSTANSAPWFDPQNPVSPAAIARERAVTPVTSWVRGEDGGVLDTTTIGPSGIAMRAWRGPIAYDNRVLNVDGAPVRDFTVRLHLDNAAPDIEARARAGVEELFNQGYRLPNGEQFHVTLEFTDNEGDAHATVNVTGPTGSANQLTWPAHTDGRRLAHEVGHFLGLRDEYLEPGGAKPIFQHQDGRGRVVGDNSPMTAGIDAPDARLKPRHLQLVENRMKALETVNPPGGPAPATRLKRSAVDAASPVEPDKRARHDRSPAAPFENLLVGSPPPGSTEPRPVPPSAGAQQAPNVAAQGSVPSDHFGDAQRQLRHLADDVLARPTPPPTTPNGLYAAVAHITHTNAATLRQHVVNRAANDPDVLRAAAAFTAGRPMLGVHLHGALVENINWRMRPDANENRAAGNARDLLGHLIATQLGVHVVIHQGPGRPPVVLAPMGGQSRGSVEVDMVMVNGQATYRPRLS